MSLLSKSKTDAIVGLDIETGSVAATEVRTNGAVEVAGYAIAPLNPGICREGEIANPQELADTLKELFAQNKLSKSVRIGVANQRLAVRSLRLPWIEDEDQLETAIRFQAQDHIPMPLEQAVLDWQVVGRSRGENGEAGHVDVVVVAGRRDMLQGLVDAASAAGLRPTGIDVSAFGMIRALAGGEPDDGADVEGGIAAATLFCNLGDVTNLAVARGTRCLFTRIAPFGVEGIAQRLAERKQLTLQHAREWLVHVGLDLPVDQVEGDPEVVAATRETLVEGATRLADELRLSLDFYGAQDTAVRTEQVVASGAGAAIPGLVDHLQTALGLPFRVGTPARLEHLDAQTVARLTLSYGLALGE